MPLITNFVASQLIACAFRKSGDFPLSCVSSLRLETTKSKITHEPVVASRRRQPRIEPSLQTGGCALYIQFLINPCFHSFHQVALHQHRVFGPRIAHDRDRHGGYG